MERKLEVDPNQAQVGKRRTYVSYLLRLWCTRDHDDAVDRGYAGSIQCIGSGGWRASLESPLTGECLGFGCLEDLFGFLREQAGPVRSTGADEGGVQC